MSPMDGQMDLVKFAKDNNLLAAVDPEQAMQAIAERILASETPEELFNPQSTDNGDKWAGKPFTIRAVEFRPSDFPGGAAIYALLRVIDENGEEGIINCGGHNVVYQLITGVKKGIIPDKPLKLERTERPTSNGFYPFWLVFA